MKILFFTLLPALIVILFFYFANKFKDHKVFILKAFILGILICFPAGYFNTYIVQTFSNTNDVNNALLMGFFAGGLTEEILKFLALLFYLPTQKKLKKFDVVIFALFISLGFAVYENFGYVFSSSENSFEIAFIRAFTAVPMHIFNGVLMGYFFEFYILSRDKKFLGYSIILPIIMHGSYNFFAFANLNISKAIILIMIFLSFKLKQIHDQNFKNYR